METGGKNSSSKVPSLTLICLPLCNFYGATMMTKGSLLLSTPFWAKIWRFWEINKGLKLNLTFITSKRHILALFHVFCAMTRKIHPSVLPVRVPPKKGINKNNFCYISPICPEGVFVRNLCIWVHLYEIWYRGLLADVINCADFF